MTTDDEMFDLLGTTLTVGASDGPRVADVERLRALAAQRQARTLATALPSQPRRRLRLLASAAAVAATFAGGLLVADLRSPATDDAAGVVEFQQKMLTTGFGQVEVVGRRVDIGRVVEIRSEAFPILPKGEFYEVWFVAEDDTPTTPMRISAGTFHPDLEGRTFVMMTAAVDPNLFPILVITAEVADGDPRPSQNEVLRETINVLG